MTAVLYKASRPQCIFNFSQLLVLQSDNYFKPPNQPIKILTFNSSNMNFFITVLVLAAFAVAEASPNLEARAGCSQRGQTCNGGTFLCCRGQGDCVGNLVGLQLPFL